MSGAQGKAAVICGAIAVVAEINESAIKKRHSQGWIMEVASNLDDCIERIKTARKNKQVVSIAYHVNFWSIYNFKGNIVDLWERFAIESELLVDLGSDQTSLHNPFQGGYYPVGMSFDEANSLMATDPKKFEVCVRESLKRHVAAINQLTKRGMKFWDYGNSL